MVSYVAKNMRKCIWGNPHFYNSIVKTFARIHPNAWSFLMLQRSVCGFSLKIQATKLTQSTIFCPSNHAIVSDVYRVWKDLKHIARVIDKWWRKNNLTFEIAKLYLFIFNIPYCICKALIYISSQYFLIPFHSM
jgi:hypothetical protein